MIPRFYRPLLIGLLPIALIACMNSAPTPPEPAAVAPLGTDLGGSGPIAAAAYGEGHGPDLQHQSGMHMAHAGHNDAHGSGTVNSVDAEQHKVNLSHNPIPEIGWPAMTMEFPVKRTVDLRAIKPGSRVNFTIEQQPGGMYEIQAISPAGGDR